MKVTREKKNDLHTEIWVRYMCIIEDNSIPSAQGKACAILAVSVMSEPMRAVMNEIKSRRTTIFILKETAIVPKRFTFLDLYGILKLLQLKLNVLSQRSNTMTRVGDQPHLDNWIGLSIIAVVANKDFPRFVRATFLNVPPRTFRTEPTATHNDNLNGPLKPE